MFTGIIAGIGRLQAREEQGGDVRLLIECGSLPCSAPRVGESIAVNGVCLTAQQWDAQAFWADVSAETLRQTTLGEREIGDQLNLERALAAGDRLGGHMVSGHVDAVARVLAVAEEARSWRFDLSIPDGLAQYLARKGSVTLDGVSLTVNTVADDRFSVNIVPHTLSVTNIAHWQVGTRINLEVDLVARYLERLMSQD